MTLSKTVEIFDDIKNYGIKKKNHTLQSLNEIYGTKDKTKIIFENIPEKIKYIPKNPAEELALEMHNADKIKFIVGRAINPAHQNPDFPIQVGLKIKLITELKEKLEKYGKEIEIEYF